MAKKGLYYNINQRKKKGISRPKSKSTITPKAYANMKAGFPKKKKERLIMPGKMMKKKMMKKGDLNKDGKMSGYEKKRSAAIQKAMKKRKK